MKSKLSLKHKILIFLIIILLLVYLIVVKPYLDFKKMENMLLDSSKRYYEINNTKLPTGKKIKKIYLKELYAKDFIDNDFKEKINNKNCSLENSFVRVNRTSNDYNCEAYLECGVLKSKIDHSGPTIKLNGNKEITIYLNEKYNELGVSSINDDTDGVINVNKVEIDSSKVNTSKVGSYEVTYKIKDSYDNITIEKRIVKVIETLNHVVKSQTKNKNIYQGSQYNNYLQLDGILFRIVGINSDNTVKIVSEESLGAVNYSDVEDWLNNYFYEKLSDSAKEYIVNTSKWCIDNVQDPNKYTKCSKYSKKNKVGLLSILDINNSKDNNDISYINSNTLVSNLKNSKKSYSYVSGNYQDIDISDNVVITPVLNIVEDATIVAGSGTSTNPYRLKGNNGYLKPGDKISDARAGEYILYSGYRWRVIGKESDGTTKVIMDNIVNKNGEEYFAGFSDSNTINFNPSKENTIGYVLANDISSYLGTKLFVNKKGNYPKYSKNIGYKAENKTNEYKLKINLPSMYDLFSTSIKNEYWYKEYSGDLYCYMYYQGYVVCKQFDSNDISGIRAVAYFDEDVTIVSGKGTSTEQYSVTIK